MQNFQLARRDDGILVFSWNMPDRSMNVIDESVMDDLESLISTLAIDADVRGAIVTSGKSSFSGGADLGMLAALGRLTIGSPAEDKRQARDAVARLGEIYRRLETCGKPVAAAINGTCLGGAFELALACHYRVSTDDPNAKLGLPESKVGLLPGAGGTQRLPRLIGTEAALKLMMKGTHINPHDALQLGALHEIAPTHELVERAASWIRSGGDAVQPWDRPGYKIPGGLPYSKSGLLMWMAANALYRKETFDNYDAQRAILSCVHDGLLVKSIEQGLRIERDYFAKLLFGRQSKVMIRSLFHSTQELNKGARRPREEPVSRVQRIGIVGAGFMGAGIAHVSARAGIEVVLIDRDTATAERGRQHTAEVFEREISRGRASEAEKRGALERIHAGSDHAALKTCDLVIEAVFEDRSVKAEAWQSIDRVMPDTALRASNTSTLPITSLAAHVVRPENFIGIHFFSPVDRMQLVEIIMGKQTSPSALARAIDYVKQIRKTPVVVNDSRGFFTSRVVTAHIAEAHHMLEEGVPPVLIEHAGRMAGMPVGPLALADEIALDLQWKILMATKSDLGSAYHEGPMDRILEEMVVKRGRFGRKNGMGYYDYPASGRKRLWPGLAGIVASRPAQQFDFGSLKERILLIQALETARCFAEKVLTDVREADVGAILGFGFAPFTGGPLSYIDTMGAEAFVRKCRSYARLYGSRYEPPALLKDMARKRTGFYDSFAA
jgi:3-hydroxyacyl-CoA dehydrogenase/enoyl-CoA hydratase/3-hydroxybutyryl-CoA epimerase